VRRRCGHSGIKNMRAWRRTRVCDAADAFECEALSNPGRPKGIPSRLLEHPATLFMPHLGSTVESVRRDIELRAVANIADWACGRPPRDAVNHPGLAKDIH